MEIIFGIAKMWKPAKMKSAQNHMKSHSLLSPSWVTFYYECES